MSCSPLATPFYTYLYLRYNGTPSYVGKGHGNRVYQKHGHHVKPPANRKFILIQEFPSEADALAAEMFLIAYYGRKDLGTGCLRNRTECSTGQIVQKERNTMSQTHRDADVKKSKHPTKVHPGYNGKDSDLSGQLSKTLVGHSRHAGVSREADEKMIASQRDSSPSLNKALPPNAEALEAPQQAGKLPEPTGDDQQ